MLHIKQCSNQFTNFKFKIKQLLIWQCIIWAIFEDPIDMLFIIVNFITGVNFINILRAAFTLADPKSTKKDSQAVCFALLGSVSVKA
jgi:hypothetical protein